MIRVLITYAGGFFPGWDIVRFFYLVPRVVHMFMLLATMDIWYLHVLLTIQSLTSTLGVTSIFQLPKKAQISFDFVGT